MVRRALGLLVCLGTVVHASPVLDRDPSHYLVLGMKRVRLKSLAVEAPGCNVGVNCPHPAADPKCGTLRAKAATFLGDSQIVADQMCATDTFAAVFRNGPDVCNPKCDAIAMPGSASDCSSPFTTPILPDLDGDGTPSCTADCAIDADDVARACGVTLPLPACDHARTVNALVDADCDTGDVVPGNFQCDLAAGTYGTVVVRDGATVVFGAGTTVVCGVKGGRSIRVKSAGPATVLVPGSGLVKLGNQADVGGACGALAFVTERGNLRFGKYGDYNADACSAFGKLRLGHGNNLRGRFIGSDVIMDSNNDGRCCVAAGSGSTTTTTVPGSTTSSTAVGSTTTTGAGSTTTTSGGSTTTTGAGSTTTTTGGSTTTTGTGSTTTHTTTTTLAGSTTTTTLASGAFTRTIGFYKNHPAITASILSAHGPLTVCGATISDVDVGHAHSALEALCVSPGGDQRLQLVRQLVAAALSTAAGGAQFDPTTCNAVCANPAAGTAALTACIDAADGFNQSGDGVRAPWDPAGAADTKSCKAAQDSACTVLAPASCAVP